MGYSVSWHRIVIGQTPSPPFLNTNRNFCHSLFSWLRHLKFFYGGCMGWRIPSLSKSHFLSHQLSHLTTVWQWLQSHLSYLKHHSHYTSYCKANILTNSTILYSVAFNLSIKEYYYNNLSSHSSLAKISYCSEIRTRTGGIRWPLFLHIIIYIQHMIHSILASMFGFPFWKGGCLERHHLFPQTYISQYYIVIVGPTMTLWVLNYKKGDCFWEFLSIFLSLSFLCRGCCDLWPQIYQF